MGRSDDGVGTACCCSKRRRRKHSTIADGATVVDLDAVADTVVVMEAVLRGRGLYIVHGRNIDGRKDVRKGKLGGLRCWCFVVVCN